MAPLIRHRWLVAVSVLLAPAASARADTAAAGPCTPVVRVSGEPALVGPVVDLLRARRLAVAGASRCGAVSAALAAAGPGERVRVTIVDPDGRTIERIADDVEGAATAIESWARRDVSDPLLQARAVAVGPAPAAAAVDEPEAAPGGTRSVEVELGADGGVSDDGALWAGARARGCVQLGALCVGGLARYARDSEARGDSAEFESSRHSVSLLLTADLPLRRGRLWWSPGAGIGQASIHASRGQDTEDTIALQLRGHLAAGWRLAGPWSLRVDLAAEYAPLANTRLGDEPDDSGDDMPLAGAPRWLGWLALGIAYGGS